MCGSASCRVWNRHNSINLCAYSLKSEDEIEEKDKGLIFCDRVALRDSSQTFSKGRGRRATVPVFYSDVGALCPKGPEIMLVSKPALVKLRSRG